VAIPQLVCEMSFLTTSAWKRKYFAEGSEPSEPTVRRWLSLGEIPGRKIGGTWYVDESAFLAANDPLVERVLKAG